MIENLVFGLASLVIFGLLFCILESWYVRRQAKKGHLHCGCNSCGGPPA